MPRKNRASKRPSCDTQLIHREWKQEPAVRHTAVKTDRLFESSQASENGQSTAIKFCIKDAVHNRFVLEPLLHRMAKVEVHPLPYLDNLLNERLASITHIVYIFSYLSICNMHIHPYVQYVSLYMHINSFTYIETILGVHVHLVICIRVFVGFGNLHENTYQTTIGSFLFAVHLFYIALTLYFIIELINLSL